MPPGAKRIRLRDPLAANTLYPAQPQATVRRAGITAAELRAGRLPQVVRISGDYRLAC